MCLKRGWISCLWNLCTIYLSPLYIYHKNSVFCTEFVYYYNCKLFFLGKACYFIIHCIIALQKLPQHITRMFLWKHYNVWLRITGNSSFPIWFIHGVPFSSFSAYFGLMGVIYLLQVTLLLFHYNKTLHKTSNFSIYTIYSKI